MTKKRIGGIAILTALAVAGGAWAQAAPKPAAPAPPAMPKPGPETQALRPFIGSFTWTGTAKAGAFGPGSPEMPTRGRERCRWILGNLWAECELQDTAGKGKQAITWKATELVGYDLMAKQYVAAFVDNMGGMMTMKGMLEGSKLTFEGAGMMNGEPWKDRVTYDASNPKAIQFTEERSMKGSPFAVAEEATMKRSGK